METWDKTCYIVQIRYDGKIWWNLAETYFSTSSAARRHSTRDAASAAMAKLNVQIQRGVWESASKSFKVEDIRIVKMSTTWTVVD